MREITLDQYLELARSQQQQGKLTEAIATYRQAINKFPQNYQPYNFLGQALVEQGDLDSAIAILRQSIALEPDVSWHYYNLAQALAKQGDSSVAVSYYQRAIELKPDFYWSYFHLGRLWSEQENFTAATACYRKAIELNSKDPWVHYWLAESLTQQGDVKTAISHYQQAIKIDPRRSLFYEKIYFLKRKIAQGNPCINSATSNNSNQDTAKNEIATKINSLQDNAETFLAKKKLKLALECYQEIINIDDNYGQVYYQIGEIYQKLDQQDFARQYYQKANIFQDFASDSKVMLVCFSARYITAKCRYHFLDLLSDFSAKKLFVRDIQDVWYNKGLAGITQNVESTANYLKNIIKQENTEKVVFLGASSGGYAALLYGCLLKVDEIHAFGAQTKIPNNSEEIELLKNVKSKYFDLEKVYQAELNTTNCHLYFDTQFPPDVEHAHRLQNIANVKLHGYYAAVGHKIAMWLKHQELLKPIILNALS